MHFLLGPATVALAIPLYEQRGTLRRLLVPILGALLVGSVSAVVAAAMLAQLLGASAPTILSLVPKSATTAEIDPTSKAPRIGTSSRRSVPRCS